MKFCIVHYNTPELTACLCSSILKLHENAEIVIFDNSDKRPFDKKLADVYYDNTKGQIIDFEKELKKYPDRNIKEQQQTGVNFGSAKHSMSIDWLCKNIKENFILMDSDILLKRKVDFEDENFICVADIIKIKSDIERISPMLAYINTKKMHENGITFFDGKRMHGLCKITERYLYYDTGTSFLEDIRKKGLFKKYDLTDYYVHYGNGSWRNSDKSKCAADTKKPYENISYKAWLMKYVSLWS